MHLKNASSPAYLVNVNISEGEELYVYKDSHLVVQSPTAERLKMADILKIDPMKLSPFSIFVGHGYLRHAGAEYLEHLGLRYQVYFVSVGVALNDSNGLLTNGAL